MICMWVMSFNKILKYSSSYWHYWYTSLVVTRSTVIPTLSSREKEIQHVHTMEVNHLFQKSGIRNCPKKKN
jgi:hypothetical protein